MAGKIHLRLVTPDETASLEEVGLIAPLDATSRLKKKVTYLTSGLVVMGCLAGIAVSYASCDNALSMPENASFTEDLDKNGIPNQVVELQDHHKVPLYGVLYEGRIIYLSGAEMKKRPDNIIDYDSIERLLNEDE